MVLAHQVPEVTLSNDRQLLGGGFIQQRGCQHLCNPFKKTRGSLKFVTYVQMNVRIDWLLRFFLVVVVVVGGRKSKMTHEGRARWPVQRSCYVKAAFGGAWLCQWGQALCWHMARVLSWCLFFGAQLYNLGFGCWKAQPKHQATIGYLLVLDGMYTHWLLIFTLPVAGIFRFQDEIGPEGPGWEVHPTKLNRRSGPTHRIILKDLRVESVRSDMNCFHHGWHETPWAIFGGFIMNDR